MGEQRTTLGFNRGLFIGAGTFCCVLALAVPVVAILLSLDRDHKNHSELFWVIPLVAIYATILTFQGVRILRTRVTVTPTTLAAYWYQGRRPVFSAKKEEIADIEIRQIPPASVRGSGDGVAPYVSLRDGSGFWLRALSVNDRRGGGAEQVAALDRISDMMGLSIAHPVAPSPIPAMPSTESPDPTYPPPQGPPPNYDPARYEGQVVSTIPTLPPPGSAAGWLPDPVMSSGYRYFDGTRWTEWVYSGSYVVVSHLPVS
jgi:hypothetical protein